LFRAYLRKGIASPALGARETIGGLQAGIDHGGPRPLSFKLIFRGMRS
jgi:hypothetical protein